MVEEDSRIDEPLRLKFMLSPKGERSMFITFKTNTHRERSLLEKCGLRVERRLTGPLPKFIAIGTQLHVQKLLKNEEVERIEECE